jgi:hypothetical protein
VTAHALRTRLARVAAAALAALLAAAAPAQEEARSYDIPARGTLTLSVPADWFDEPKVGPSGIPSIRFFDRLEAPRAFDMSVTVLWSTPGASPYAAKNQLRALVAKAAEDVAPGAAERDFPLQEFPVENGAGFYFEATAKAAEPGEPAYLTRGALAAGDVTITFTILTTQHRSPAVTQALDMLRTARREGAQN